MKLKSYLPAAAFVLFANSINAAEKSAKAMSEDADGWILTGLIVMLILAVAATSLTVGEMIYTRFKERKTP